MPELGGKKALCLSTGGMENGVLARWGKPHNMLVDVVVLGVSLSLAVIAQERLALVGRHRGGSSACDRLCSPGIAQSQGRPRCIYDRMEGWGRGAFRADPEGRAVQVPRAGVSGDVAGDWEKMQYDHHGVRGSACNGASADPRGQIGRWSVGLM